MKDFPLFTWLVTYPHEPLCRFAECPVRDASGRTRLPVKPRAEPLLCPHVASAWRGNWCWAPNGRIKPKQHTRVWFCSTAASGQCETMPNIQISEKFGIVCLLFFLRVYILLCPRVDFNTEKIIYRSKINRGNQLLVENRHPLSSRAACKIQSVCLAFRCAFGLTNNPSCFQQLHQQSI